MTAKTRSEARSLIVVSKDFGELSFAMSFVRGQAFAGRARMLLPDDHYSRNEGTLPVSVSRYATREDILAEVDAHGPDLVFLFSGYLLSHDRLLSPQVLDSLVRYLRDRRCHVVTSDPFLGLAPRLTLAQMDTRMLFSARPVLTRWLSRIQMRLLSSKTQMVRVQSMETATQLYATSTPDADVEEPIQRLSFFNPTTVHADADARIVGGGSAARAADSTGRWLFVLSVTDVACQGALLGLRGFTRVVARLLVNTLRVGKRPVLIAPALTVEVLSKGLPNAVELVPLCPFVEFETQLFDAEYAFYWNAFAFSIIPRLANGLPVFLFDRGPLARTIQPFYQAGISCHFGGWVPPYLDQKQPLDPSMLVDLAEKQELAMRIIRERWQSSATPDEVVDQLLRERVRPGMNIAHDR
jgi:hypothetical protein